MTRRDFESLAEILRNLVHLPQFDGEEGLRNYDQLVKRFASALDVRNPNFDKQRFLSECNITDGG